MIPVGLKSEEKITTQTGVRVTSVQSEHQHMLPQRNSVRLGCRYREPVSQVTSDLANVQGRTDRARDAMDGVCIDIGKGVCDMRGTVLDSVKMVILEM